MRQGSRAPSSSIRPPSRATGPSRLDVRSGAASPAVSVSSHAASSNAGLKRKERDFEAEFSQETNINVVVRCRGRSGREVRENSAVVVKTDGVMGKHIDVSMGPNALSNKTYAFDRVFSQAADQSMLFDDVVKPILAEVSRPSTGWRKQRRELTIQIRCLLASTARYSPTARLVQARPIPCLVT